MIVMSLPQVPLPSSHDPAQLPNSTSQPSAYDILLGRHKHCFHHVGNQAFRTLILKFMMLYSTLESKREKMNLVTAILGIIQQGGGRFLREGAGSQWNAVKKRTAREKISHALRDHCNRIQYRNNTNNESNSGGATTTTSTARRGSSTSTAAVPTPSACWRTLVYETVQNQKGGPSKKVSAEVVQENESSQQYDHLDTKNHSFSLLETTRASMEESRRNLVNSMMRSNQYLEAAPRYLPSSSHATRSLPLYDPGITTTANSSSLMNDAMRQIELLGRAGRAEVAASLGAGDEEREGTASGNPDYSRLVTPSLSAAARSASLSRTVGGADESKMGEFATSAFGSPMRNNAPETYRRDSLGAFFEPSDTFGGDNLLNTVGDGLGGGIIGRTGSDFLGREGLDAAPTGLVARFPNQDVAASLLDMHHHQHEHSRQQQQQDESMDPLPFQHSYSSTSAVAFPPPASYTDETEDAMVDSHGHSQQHAQQNESQHDESGDGTRHQRKNTDQHIDSLLLDLFKR